MDGSACSPNTLTSRRRHRGSCSAVGRAPSYATPVHCSYRQTLMAAASNAYRRPTASPPATPWRCFRCHGLGHFAQDYKRPMHVAGAMTGGSAIADDGDNSRGSAGLSGGALGKGEPLGRWAITDDSDNNVLDRTAPAPDSSSMRAPSSRRSGAAT